MDEQNDLLELVKAAATETLKQCPHKNFEIEANELSDKRVMAFGFTVRAAETIDKEIWYVEFSSFGSLLGVDTIIESTAYPSALDFLRQYILQKESAT